MLKAFRTCAVTLILAAVAAIAPATAQFPPSSDDQQDQAAGTPKAKKSAVPAGPNVNGSWSGQLSQVGSQTPYKFELVINAKGAETKYPDLDCLGKLTRVGSSKSYAFFVEVITKGQVEKGGRCPDGTITVTRQGDDLALGWFGSVQGNTIIAYGTLRKK
jgi:hypothetical protein